MLCSTAQAFFFIRSLIDDEKRFAASTPGTWGNTPSGVFRNASGRETRGGS